MKAPTAYEVMGKYIDHEKKLIDNYIGVLNKQWPKYEVTIMYDG